jgi:hypothetical protein
MNKKLSALTLLSLTCALAACGGGGGGESDPAGAAGPASAPASAPSPSASPIVIPGTGSGPVAFVSGVAPRFVLYGLGSQQNGQAVPFVQGKDGAVTTLGTNTLSGSPAVTKEIAGDASFAQGRWTQGTVTASYGASTLTGTSSEAFHYAAYNPLLTTPASGTPVCGPGRVTAPTYTSSSLVGAPTKSGTATAAATLAFSSAGAAVEVTITATASASVGTIKGAGMITVPSQMLFTDGFFGSGVGTNLALGEVGPGTYLVVAGFKVRLANGALHQGVATFTCK